MNEQDRFQGVDVSYLGNQIMNMDVGIVFISPTLGCSGNYLIRARVEQDGRFRNVCAWADQEEYEMFKQTKNNPRLNQGE